MSLSAHGVNSPVMTHRRCLLETVGLRDFDCTGGMKSCVGILREVRLTSCAVRNSSHLVDVKVW